MSCVVISKYSKNQYSKVGKSKGDVLAMDAMDGTAEVLRNILDNKGLYERFRILHKKEMTFGEIMKYRNLRIKQINGEVMYENFFDKEYEDNRVRPDGGVLILVDVKTNKEYPLLISEMKYQGTNKGRVKDGLKKQAAGNANERAGRYASLFRDLWEFDDILPLVIFHCGCDYSFIKGTNAPKDGSARTQFFKLISMNAFCPINKVYLSTNMPKVRRNLPNTVMVKEDFWTMREVRNVLDKVGKDSLNYYLKLILDL